ncbi:MAG: tRNA (adenosine(37)-N6)-threonylcarbamoyltransferase complex ATPase subunit type 1 TsaE [Clostridia bacterium]|nr:tRNA (adenosine(37)-N6)-threonylcarbamoyltransferase complex ATPase subunit type 1 TsaE [Clostridia bacterium]
MAVFYSHAEADTIAWAKEYAKSLKPGDVVLLEGTMGAGKTMLAKGIIAGMGILDEVTSPTYAYVNVYGDRLFHFDCYRITSEAQALALGFADYFEEGGICLVEWSENIRGILPETCKILKISGAGDGVREIEF